MSEHFYLRPRVVPDPQATASTLATRVGGDVGTVAKILEQEAFYLRTYGQPVEAGLQVDAEAETRWIAERLRIKRNRVRSVLDAYSALLQEREQPVAALED